MILDSGIATFYHKVNIAPNGAKPVFDNVQFYEAFFGELHFETNPEWQTERREDVRTDARIRILQNRNINNHDRVLLNPKKSQNPSVRGVRGSVDPVKPDYFYEVTRAYHGVDDDSGELITDLSLIRTDAEYEDNTEKYFRLPEEAYTGVGVMQYIEVELSPGITDEIVWTSSDTGIAYMVQDEEGYAVMGVTLGECDITGTVDGMTATMHVYVLPK